MQLCTTLLSTISSIYYIVALQTNQGEEAHVGSTMANLRQRQYVTEGREFEFQPSTNEFFYSKNSSNITVSTVTSIFVSDDGLVT